MLCSGEKALQKPLNQELWEASCKPSPYQGKLS